jgi:ABC-type dipeptide/oligopeptide/nickel transport system ATPase subunit
MPREAYNSECLFPAVKHGDGCVMIWVAISWYSAGPISTSNGQITASGYIDILGNQGYPMAQMFHNIDAVFQDDSSPMHTTISVQFWFEEHEDTLHCLP